MKNLYRILAFALFTLTANAQVGIGISTPDASAALDITSTDKGLLLPRLTTAARTGITLPAAGLQVYDTDTNSVWFYNGTVWTEAVSDGDSWGVAGEDITSEIKRTGNVIIGGTAQIGGATPKLAVQNNDNVQTSTNITPIEMVHLSREGTNGNKWGTNAQFKLGSYSTHVNSRSSLEIALTDVNTESTYNTVMTLNANGNVGIGTTTPTEKLHVDGDILATGNITPDYVFQKYYDGTSSLKEDYKMMSLKEIEAFTKENKHLPGVPSYKEVEEKGGIVLNRASEIQLEKIEELFLHTIEQQKTIETLKLRLEKLEKQLKEDKE